jgi:hypothetical protein
MRGVFFRFVGTLAATRVRCGRCFTKSSARLTTYVASGTPLVRAAVAANWLRARRATSRPRRYDRSESWPTVTEFENGRFRHVDHQILGAQAVCVQTPFRSQMGCPISLNLLTLSAPRSLRAFEPGDASALRTASRLAS